MLQEYAGLVQRRMNDELLPPQKKGESQWPHYLQQATKAGLFMGEGMMNYCIHKRQLKVSDLTICNRLPKQDSSLRVRAAIAANIFPLR